jgi:hypothetical protein
MEETRQTLILHNLKQLAIKKTSKLNSIIEKTNKKAGISHHLLGTVANPGIYSTETLKKFKQIQKESPNEGNEIEGSVILTEDNLRYNPTIEMFYDEKIFQKSKLLSKNVSESPVKEKKLAQGPFLPKERLDKKKFLQFSPTLRVQTDFNATKIYLREEKEKEKTLRGLFMNSHFFSIIPPIANRKVCEAQPSRLLSEEYSLHENGIWIKVFLNNLTRCKILS